MFIRSLARHAIPGGIRNKLRNYFPDKGIVWRIDPSQAPWFDQPNALELLEERRRKQNLSARDCELLRQWVEAGYVVVKKAVSDELIDGMMADFEGLWTAQRPLEGLEFCDLKFGDDEPIRTVSHQELLEIEEAKRLSARLRTTTWRVHGFQAQSPNANSIFRDPELNRIANLILDHKAAPLASISFQYGSEQLAHQDTAVFHVFPPNYIVGAWLACEDISPDCGPLMIYPKSHREKLFKGFKNYPQTNLRTANPELSERYREYVSELTRQYERKLFLAKKGDVLLWHGMLLHGGSEIKDRGLTRKSYAFHYFPPPMDVSDRIVGPFNW